VVKTISRRAACPEKAENTLLARVTGLEPATSGVTGRRSNQLSYTRKAVCGPCNVLFVQRQARDMHQTIFKLHTKVALRQTRPKTKKKQGKQGIGGDGFEPPTLSV